MDKTELDRLRQLAGNETAKKLPQDESGRNMYQIRDLMEDAQDSKELEEEEAKPDFADIDGDGDEKETAKKAAKDKEKSKKSAKTEQQQMREWSNSIYKQYDDRGHYQEPPEGETVDLSLRRYLNADPQKVQIEEDHTEEGMLKEYKAHKKKG